MKWLKKIWLKIWSKIKWLFGKRKMQNNNIINVDCWIAYFDVLGFRNRVEMLPWQSVRETYNEILKVIQQNNGTVSCKWFSDTFFFYTPDDKEESFLYIESSLRSIFQTIFFTKKIPFRGCLTVGNVYINPDENIFYGQGFLEAHDIAENEEWIGYVLSENASEKAKRFSANRESVLDKLLKYQYRQYDVPFKNNKKKRLVVPNFNIDFNGNSPNAVTHQIQLWNALITMQEVAKIFVCEKAKSEKISGMARCREFEQVLRKYNNTKDFLLDTFPRLKEKIKNKNKQISP